MHSKMKIQTNILFMIHQSFDQMAAADTVSNATKS